MRKELIFICCLFLVSSCVSDGGSSGSERAWMSGTEGVRMSFVQDNPSSEVLSTQQMVVMVEYANKGTYNLKPGELQFYLTGYDPTILFGNPVMYSGNLGAIDGKDQYNPQGSQEAFYKWVTNVNLGNINDVDSFTQDMTITACYHYKTTAVPDVCIDPNKYEYSVSTSCPYEVNGLGSSQGAPIAVTGVKQKSTGDAVYFEIEFQNKGNGIPFLASKEACYSNLELKDVNVVEIESVTISGMEFSASCKPDKKIRLINGKGFAVCNRPISGQSYFTAPMKIVLDYNYRDTMSKKITVVNVNR